MTEMTRDELVERYNAGERIFDGIELVKWSLSGLSKTKLYNLFKGVVLRDIMLRGADIRFELNMTGADLSGANLRGAYFEKVDLTGANFTGADLRGAVFKDCCVDNAIIRANLFAANISGSTFCGSDFTGSNLGEINAAFAEMGGCKMGGTEHSIFAGTNFQGAEITEGYICSGMNLIWNTIMPSGRIIEKPQWGNGRGDLR
jgi:uncharacterized protein YjbI with pentapeptide repeats